MFAGIISPAKGLDVLVDAWRAIGKATSLRLVVVGGFERQHAAYADDLRLRLAAVDDAVTWRGWVDDDAFNSIIATAGIVVLPYRESNPVSGILVRAAVEGRAIVGSSVPAVADFLEDGVTGVILGAGDVIGLARAAACPR